MSDNVPPRPRPKPRPRPRPATAQSSTTLGTSGPSTAAAGTVPLGDIVINDSDDLFVINRGRTRETWKKLDEINRVNARPASDAESDDEPSTPLRKRIKKQETPKWQKEQDALRTLSVELSDDDDDEGSDLEITGGTARGKGRQLQSPNKRKRFKARSRSRSLTPPPEPSAAVLQRARELVRQHVNVQRAPSPTNFEDFEDSTDTIVLDPELERIAKAVTSQSGGGQSIPQTSGTSETLTISVKWQKHPLNPVEQERLWSYRISRDDPFRELFDAVAEDAQILASTLVLSYRNKRLFPSTRPDALGLWGEVTFVACQQKTYDYLQQHARELRRSETPVRTVHPRDTGSDNDDRDVINLASDDEDEDIMINSHTFQPTRSANANTNTNSPPAKASQESDAESESDSEKFKLILRSNKVAKDITLIVRPTTKCGAIVRAYIKKAGLADEYAHVIAEGDAVAEPPATTRGRGRGGKGRGRGRGKAVAQAPIQALSDPRISVDGDKMENDTEIGEADLEDGDMVEVVGL
ncbi:hypothetical protein P691DRAFT_810094 [Macrolepiota fuliginosa MF-IS2]|uniref:Rad60/SUMO-like domain-containing protein n=1 Tax=Macrolepiota fuliginosa MF-IS2 TaxID=1400762 RepID=A0A9P5XJ91_9AGAR|nr:hypothetical protein P691DRAFT_810094 [Macrolepiota fuliginosa MF-IS2]